MYEDAPCVRAEYRSRSSSASTDVRYGINPRVAKVDESRIGGLDAGASNPIEPPRRLSRLLLLLPLAGVVAIFAEFIRYPLLDDALTYWIAAIPCVIMALLINIAWRKAQAGADVPSFLPRTIWLAAGCLFVPLVLLVNGALDHSPVEQHRQVVIRKIRQGGKGGPYYYLELTSWRANKTYEKVMVAERWYLQAQPGDPVIVETHRGALGIPILASIHSPD